MPISDIVQILLWQSLPGDTGSQTATATAAAWPGTPIPCLVTFHDTWVMDLTLKGGGLPPPQK